MTTPLPPCPCCGFPTLEARAACDICVICWWKDDGQDAPHADEVWAGPNKDYALSQARRNFRAHGHMYDKGDGIDVAEYPCAHRRALLAGVDAVRKGREKLAPERLTGCLHRIKPPIPPAPAKSLNRTAQPAMVRP